MKIINKYIIKTLLNYILGVAFVFLTIFSFFNFLNEVSNIGINQYTIISAIYFTFLHIPELFYEQSISIILLGVILAMGNLASTSQLIVARNMGMSIVHISCIAATFAVFMFFVIAIFGEAVTSSLNYYSADYKANKLGRSNHNDNKVGFWIKDGDYFINAKKSYENKIFGDINIVEIKNNSLKKSIFAKKMIINNNELLLQNVLINNLDDYRIIAKHYDNYKLNISFDNKIVQALEEIPYTLSIIDVYQQLSFLRKNNIKSAIFEIEFYSRLLKPFILITTILFSMLFIFGSLRDSSLGKKVFLGVAISLLFELGTRISGAIVLKFDYNYLLITIIPIVLMLILSTVLLFKKSNQ